jgi:signal transduction histidine kinase
MLIKDDETIDLINPSACQLFQLKKSLAAGKKLREVPVPSQLVEVVGKVIENGQVIEEKINLNQPDRELLARCQPINQEASLTAVLVIIKDVTRSEQLKRFRQDFVANVSHELKTPITGLKLLSDALNQSLDQANEATHFFAQRLEKETSRLSLLITDLLDLSRLESTKPVFKVFPLRKHLERVLASFAEAAQAKEIHIKANFHPSVSKFYGDQYQIELMVGNLVDNAIRYTSKGGTINVNVSQNQCLSIEVIDTGIGIPAKHQKRIFERFYRVDKARSHKSGGTGLGLSIVKHVVQNHLGKVEVESKPGQGSKFKVTLPINLS